MSVEMYKHLILISEFRNLFFHFNDKSAWYLSNWEYVFTVNVVKKSFEIWAKQVKNDAFNIKSGNSDMLTNKREWKTKTPNVS